jgi:hypothetical protein
MADESDPGGGRAGRRGKVARLVDEHGLESLGAELEARWTADGDDRMSLRALATLFNRRLLDAALSRADAQPLSGEAENLHRLLTAEDVSGAERTRARRRLERQGVDVDALLDDFVSYQAVRTYLRDERGAEYEAADGSDPAAALEHVQRLQGRTASVTEERVERLTRRDDLSLGDARVLVSVAVLCEDCGARYDVAELFDRGGCDCEPA